MKTIYKNINQMHKEEMKIIHLKNKLGVCVWIMIGLLVFKFILIINLISTGEILI